MQKPTFLQLVQIVEPEIRKRNTVFRHAISPAKRVAIALWRLAGGAVFVQLRPILMLENQLA